MGKLLYIRVNSSTYDEKQVKKNYPTLCELVWSEKDAYIPAAQFFGVLELITTLHESLEFANYPQEVQDILAEDVAKLMLLKEELSQFITTWKVQEADKITYTIEESLAELEAKAKDNKILKIIKKK